MTQTDPTWQDILGAITPFLGLGSAMLGPWADGAEAASGLSAASSILGETSAASNLSGGAVQIEDVRFLK